jgi:hypothetical protein
MPRNIPMRLAAIGLIASAQFVHEMLQVRRMVGRVGAKNLLETLAHGIADRSAGRVIERFNIICG